MTHGWGWLDEDLRARRARVALKKDEDWDEEEGWEEEDDDEEDDDDEDWDEDEVDEEEWDEWEEEDTDLHRRRIGRDGWQ